MSRTPIAPVASYGRRYVFTDVVDPRDPPRPTNPGEPIGVFDLAEYVRRTVLAHADHAHATAIAGFKTAGANVLCALFIVMVMPAMVLTLQFLAPPPPTSHQEPAATTVTTTSEVEAPAPGTAPSNAPAAPPRLEAIAATQRLTTTVEEATAGITNLVITAMKVFGGLFAGFLVLIALSRLLLSLRHYRDARTARQQMSLIPEGTASQAPVIDAVIASMLERGEIVDANDPRRPASRAPATAMA